MFLKMSDVVFFFPTLTWLWCIPRRGMFFVFHVIFSKMVIIGQQKWFMDQIFWKMTIFGQILSNRIYSSFCFVSVGKKRAARAARFLSLSPRPLPIHKSELFFNLGVILMKWDSRVMSNWMWLQFAAPSVESKSQFSLESQILSYFINLWLDRMSLRDRGRRSIYMIDPFMWSFIWSIHLYDHLYDRSIYIIKSDKILSFFKKSGP